MKNKIKQALVDYFDGSRKLAQYAYYLLERYMEEYEGYDNVGDGENFYDWGQYEADKDDYTYTAFYTLYDYGADNSSDYLGAYALFENIIEIYLDNFEE